MNTLTKTAPRHLASAILFALALNVCPGLAGQAPPVHWGAPGEGLPLGIQFTSGYPPPPANPSSQNSTDLPTWNGAAFLLPTLPDN